MPSARGKMQLDYELVRALKCAELQRQGFAIRPGTRVAFLCQDIVPIQSLLPPQPKENKWKLPWNKKPTQ